MRNLKAKDFEIRQDGVRQPLRYMSEDPDAPLSLALMVDTSGSQRRFLADETAASNVFFPAVLTQSKDRAALIQFDDDILRLQDLTTSTDALKAALTQMQKHHPQRADLKLLGKGGTLLYDGLCQVSEQLFRQESGRRAIVLLTDGNDWRSPVTFDQALACVQWNDVVVFSVLYTTNAGYASPGLMKGVDVLQKLAGETGGSMYTVSAQNPLTKIYSDIAASLRDQYLLGYREPATKPGAYHRIILLVRKRHAVVQARQGYYAREATQTP